MIRAILTRIEEQLAHMSDEVTLTAIEAEQTPRTTRPTLSGGASL